MNAPSLQRCTPSSEWYAVYTRHQREKTVFERFARTGFDAFLPTYRVVRQWKDRIKQLSLPLFPCYVFLHGGLDRRLEVLSTPGVHSLVSFAGRPAPIPEIQVEAIRTVIENHLPVEPHPFLRCGEWVRVTSGPLTEIEGILVRRKSSLRLVLSADLLGKSIAVEVDAFTVEPSASSYSQTASIHRNPSLCLSPVGKTDLGRRSRPRGATAMRVKSQLAWATAFLVKDLTEDIQLRRCDLIHVPKTDRPKSESSRPVQPLGCRYLESALSTEEGNLTIGETFYPRIEAPPARMAHRDWRDSTALF